MRPRHIDDVIHVETSRNSRSHDITLDLIYVRRGDVHDASSRGNDNLGDTRAKSAKYHGVYSVPQHQTLRENPGPGLAVRILCISAVRMLTACQRRLNKP